MLWLIQLIFCSQHRPSSKWVDLKYNMPITYLLVRLFQTHFPLKSSLESVNKYVTMIATDILLTPLVKSNMGEFYVQFAHYLFIGPFVSHKLPPINNYVTFNAVNILLTQVAKSETGGFEV